MAVGGGTMITIVLVFITSALLVALVSVPVFLWWRWKRNERRRRENQLYSVYLHQVRRDRRGR